MRLKVPIQFYDSTPLLQQGPSLPAHYEALCSGKAEHRLRGVAVSASVVHFQVPAREPDELAAFYRNVLGWSVRDARLSEVSGAASGPYRWVDPGDERGVSGAIVDKKVFAGREPPGAVVVVEVDDLSETLDKVRQYGGEVLGPSDQLQLSGAGDADGAFSLAMFADPEGNQIALVQS